MGNIKIVIADDHSIVLQGLVSMLKDEEDIQIIGTAQNGKKAVELAHSLKPDVLIMDIAMPEKNGIEAAKEILRLIVKGLSVKEIADKLFISVKTVDTHKARIMKKLNVTKSTELVQKAIQENLI